VGEVWAHFGLARIERPRWELQHGKGGATLLIGNLMRHLLERLLKDEGELRSFLSVKARLLDVDDVLEAVEEEAEVLDGEVCSRRENPQLVEVVVGRLFATDKLFSTFNGGDHLEMKVNLGRLFADRLGRLDKEAAQIVDMSL